MKWKHSVLGGKHWNAYGGALAISQVHHQALLPVMMTF